ncbi:hypothetical protein GCM10017750_31540 [Streptomyces racemochromogenes]
MQFSYGSVKRPAGTRSERSGRPAPVSKPAAAAKDGSPRRVVPRRCAGGRQLTPGTIDYVPGALGAPVQSIAKTVCMALFPAKF